MKLYEYDFMDEKEYAIGFNKGSSFVFCGYGKVLNDKEGYQQVDYYIRDRIYGKRDRLKEQIDDFDNTYKVYTSRTLSMKKRIKSKVTLRTRDEYLNRLLDQYNKIKDIVYDELNTCDIDDIYYSTLFDRTIILLKSPYPINGVFWTKEDCNKKIIF